MSVSADLFLEYVRRPTPQALARLLREHEGSVYNVCFQVLRHPQDAEDACQEVFLEAVRQVRTVRDPERFGSWLCRAAFHTALDLKRKRGRRVAREAVVPPGAGDVSDEAHAVLHEALAHLDDETRWMLVEHYFNRRTLGELAGERGCSTVAVWKKIEKGKERLRRALARSAPAAVPLDAILDSLSPAVSPKNLVSEAALSSASPTVTAAGIAGGGVVMATKGSFALATAGVLLVLGIAGGGIFMASRSPRGEKALAASPVLDLAPAPPDSVPASSSSLAMDRPASPVSEFILPERKPYPYQLPPVPWPEAKRQTWWLLREKKLHMSLSAQPVRFFLELVGDMTGVRIVAEDSMLQELVTIEVIDIPASSILRLVFGGKGLDSDIQDDGTVRIVTKDRIAPDPYLSEIGRARQGLEQVKRRFEWGWVGNEVDDPLEHVLRSKRIVTQAGEIDLEKVLESVRDQSGINIIADGSGQSSVLGALKQKIANQGEEYTVEAYLDRLCKEAEVGYVVVEEQVVLVTSSEKACEERARRERQKDEMRSVLRKLRVILPGADSLAMPDLADVLKKATGIPVILSREVWEDGRRVSVPAGVTVLEFMDRLSDFRWGACNETLFIVGREEPSDRFFRDR